MREAPFEDIGIKPEKMMMRGVRMKDSQWEKLQSLSLQLGMSGSEIIRFWIDSAQLLPSAADTSQNIEHG